MVQGEQQEGFDKLSLNGGCPDGEDRLPGEDGGAFGYRPNIAGKLEVLQVLQKALAEAALAPQVADVFLGKVQVLNVVDDLLQTGGDGEAAPIGNIAEENVEIADLIHISLGLEVAVAHGEFVKITQQCVVHVFLHGV